MQMRKKKEVEFRLIDSEEMPPIVIKPHEDGESLVIVLNKHHQVWLSLHRNTIPGIAERRLIIFPRSSLDFLVSLVSMVPDDSLTLASTV